MFASGLSTKASWGGRLPRIAVLVGVGLSGALPLAAADAVPVAVPVRKVVLYSSGVGYFEHAGRVEGNATAELRFKADQINDMLKSLVIEDLDGGHVGTVVYPSRDPLARTLASFQVDIRDNPTLGELLSQLRGSEVVVATPDDEVRGTIIGLEKKRRKVGDDTILETVVLNLLTDGTIRAIDLDDARRIELVDVKLRDELNRALTAFAQARGKDKKPVSVHFTGKGQRRVRLGYVVETPIWKTSYRLILPQDDQKSGKLLGWAIVENQTDSDWNHVELSLVSGRPISFIEDLYQPLYIPRPVVEPERYASLTPQRYGEGVDEEARMAGEFGTAAAVQQNPFSGGEGGSASGGVLSALRAKGKSAAPSHGRKVMKSEAKYYAGNSVKRELDAAASVASMASAADLGELFQYTVPGVTLARQRSAMIPIVTDEVEVERVSIYNPEVLAKHPLNGVLMKNTTGKHLPQGPVTVIDDAGYAGDAQIGDLPADQQRLLSYAVDLDVRVLVEGRRETNVIQSGQLIKGVLRIQRKLERELHYTLDNKSERDRTIIIEHHFRPGWKLVNTPEPYEKTERLYRFKDTVAAGKTSQLAVTEERVNLERFAILPANIGQIQTYARTAEIPAKVRKALEKAAQLKGALVETQRQLDDRAKRIRDITAEQDRIRKNMKTVDRRGDYYTRLLQKLDNQETTLEKLQTEINNLNSQLARQRAALEDYLANLNVG